MKCHLRTAQGPSCKTWNRPRPGWRLSGVASEIECHSCVGTYEFAGRASVALKNKWRAKGVRIAGD